MQAESPVAVHQDNKKASKKGREAKGIATSLTESNRSAGRDPYRRKDSKQNSIPKLAIKMCRECGEEVNNSEREFCSKKCWEKFNEDVVLLKLSKAGHENLAKLRASGKDPSHGGEAARKRGQSNARRVKERQEWERQNSKIDIEVAKRRFVSDILPMLRDVPVRKIVKTTGLSIRYASMIRRGQYVPHPMHYEKLQQLMSRFQGTSE